MSIVVANANKWPMRALRWNKMGARPVVAIYRIDFRAHSRCCLKTTKIITYIERVHARRVFYFAKNKHSDKEVKTRRFLLSIWTRFFYLLFYGKYYLEMSKILFAFVRANIIRLCAYFICLCIIIITKVILCAIANFICTSHMVLYIKFLMTITLINPDLNDGPANYIFLLPLPPN